MLAEVGLDPKTVKYREFGPQWNQAVALRLADAGLSWEGLRAQLEGTAAFFGSGNAGLKFLIGSEWGSKGPSNSYQVRTADLKDSAKVDIYTRLLAGSVMGFEFAPRQPTGGGPDRVRAVPGYAEGDHAPGCGRLDHAARKPLPHLDGGCRRTCTATTTRTRGQST